MISFKVDKFVRKVAFLRKGAGTFDNCNITFQRSTIVYSRGKRRMEWNINTDTKVWFERYNRTKNLESR